MWPVARLQSQIPGFLEACLARHYQSTTGRNSWRRRHRERAKVVTNDEGDDYIAIRHMAYFALTFDHRIIDGSDAEKFLGYLKQTLEAGQFTI